MTAGCIVRARAVFTPHQEQATIATSSSRRKCSHKDAASFTAHSNFWMCAPHEHCTTHARCKCCVNPLILTCVHRASAGAGAGLMLTISQSPIFLSLLPIHLCCGLQWAAVGWQLSSRPENWPGHDTARSCCAQVVARGGGHYSN